VPEIELNEHAGAQLQIEHRIIVVPGATHLFEESGAPAEVGLLAGEWFRRYLVTPPS
jgi:hypothetical protein